MANQTRSPYASEFAQVLAQKLGAENLRASKATEDAKATSGASQAEPASDWLAKIFFTQGPVKAQVFSSYGEPRRKVLDDGGATERPRPAVSEVKFVSEPLPPPKKETPRVKRKLNFDQVRALKVFTKFGETDINEFSTDQEIKLAYRKLAKEFHPDAGAASDENFKTLSMAYHKLLE